MEGIRVFFFFYKMGVADPPDVVNPLRVPLREELWNPPAPPGAVLWTIYR